MKNIVVPEIDRLKTKYFSKHHHPDEPLILHRKEMVNKKYPFEALKDELICKSFDEELLRILENFEYTMISVLIDKKSHKEKNYADKYEPYHYCMEVLLERFYFYLKNIGACGDVMVEARGGKEDKRLKDVFEHIYMHGTHYLTSEEIKKVFTSKKLKLKQKNRNVIGLQLADILAHPSRGFMFKEFGLEYNKKQVFGDQIINAVKEKYYRNEKKILKGYGIKFLF